VRLYGRNFLQSIVRLFHGNQAGVQLTPLLLDSLMEILKPFGSSYEEIVGVCGQKRGKNMDRSAYKMCFYLIRGGLYVQVLKALNVLVCCTNCCGMLCLIDFWWNGKWR